MESKTSQKSGLDATTLYSPKTMYWMMVAVFSLAVILDFIDRTDPLRTASGVSLAVAFVLMALSGGAPTHGRKRFVYVFLILSILLTAGRWFR